MACFIVPAVEAVITTVAEKVIKSRETPETIDVVREDGTVETVTRTPFSRKLGWLNKLLWGGVILLAFEHLWHGSFHGSRSLRPCPIREMPRKCSTK